MSTPCTYRISPFTAAILRRLRLFAALLAVVLSANQTSAQINAEQVMRVGQNALYFEDYMLSIQYFNQAIAAKPYLAQPYFLRAIAKLNLEDYKGAEEDADLSIERNPFLADAYEVRGVARQNRGKYRGAIDDYNSALKLVPESRGLLFNKAIAFQQLNRPDSAEAIFDHLLIHYPKFENGYIGRARLRLENTDTVGAKADIEKALSLNKNIANAYLLQADIAIHGPRDFEAARQAISEAIKLQPREAGLYINRAYLRHELDDYFGAMADYDYALSLDPTNATAMFNRGLLRMEVRDNDNAIADFTQVLNLDPEDYRALYNRAYLYTEARRIEQAMADVNRLVEACPDLPEALYMRSNLNRIAGNMRQAERDYNRALQMSRNLPAAGSADMASTGKPGGANSNSKTQPGSSNGAGTDPEQADAPSPEAIAKRFTALRTIDAPIEMDGEYNNKSIRGKVQDRSQRIALEPQFALTYYTSPTELKPSSYYLKQIDDINSTRILRFVVQLSNDDVNINDEDNIKRHFSSIEYYNSYIATHPPRAIDFFGRAMDFAMVRDYPSAIEDINRALALTPDFALGYFQRAYLRYRALQAGISHTTDQLSRQAETRAIIADLDKAIELAPDLTFAYFNKGNILADNGDYTSALAAFNRAIELKPDFGEAYYNRGYVYFQLGNRELGVENLSKAGELGVVPSYSLLKRMN